MNIYQPSPAYLMQSFNTLATNGREYHVQGKFKSIEWIWLELKSEECCVHLMQGAEFKIL